MYESRPDAEQLAALGMSPEDWASQDDVGVFPDNALSVRVFEAMATQWRTGMAGPLGLDYAALEVTMRLLTVPEDQALTVFGDVQYMEALALKHMRTQ